MSNVTQLRTRKPTGRPAWPLILLAGESKTGKTWALAELSGDERIGRSFMLDLNEGTADEYGAVPGADYEIIEHNGTWIDIIGQVQAAKALAAEELAAGRPPVLLGIDSMTAEWAMLTAWTNTRAKRSRNNKRLLAEDPDAEIDVSSNYWNDANSRHNELMNILKTFPGVVVMTALETEKTQFGPGGRPIEGAPKVAKPDAQKRVPADSSVWIRLSLTEEPVVVGMRSVRRTIQPGKDQPKPWPDFTLAALVFEELGISSGNAEVRNMPRLDADQTMPNEEPVQQPQGQAPAPARDTPRRDNGNDQAKAEEVRTSALKGITLILGADTAEKAEANRAHAQKSIAAGTDVLPYLEGRDVTLANLGLDDRNKVFLAKLGAEVANYWTQHGRSPVPADGTPAGQDQAADERAA